MEPAGTVPLRWRAWALALGIVTHALFAAAVLAMVAGLYSGMTVGRGTMTGVGALLANGLLVVQFPALHSWLLSRKGRPWLEGLGPQPLGRALSSTTFAAVASVQLLALFVLWSPSGEVWWQPRGAPRAALSVGFGASWAVLQKAMWDAGLALQTGFLGWGSVARGAWPRWEGFPTGGLFRTCRQPVYLAFALTLWTGPVWTPDHLALAVVLSTYCVVGPRLKERRYLARHGGEFRAYQARVPYMLPRPATLLRGGER